MEERAKIETLPDKSLLAIIDNENREDMQLLKKVLPSNAIKLDSDGYVLRGNTIQTASYLLLAAPEHEDIRQVCAEYQNRYPDSFFEIDKLAVEIVFKGRKRWGDRCEGSIDEMMKFYENLSNFSPGGLIFHQMWALLNETYSKPENEGKKLKIKEAYDGFIKRSSLGIVKLSSPTRMLLRLCHVTKEPSFVNDLEVRHVLRHKDCGTYRGRMTSLKKVG